MEVSARPCDAIAPSSVNCRAKILKLLTVLRNATQRLVDGSRCFTKCNDCDGPKTRTDERAPPQINNCRKSIHAAVLDNPRGRPVATRPTYNCLFFFRITFVIRPPQIASAPRSRRLSHAQHSAAFFSCIKVERVKTVNLFTGHYSQRISGDLCFSGQRV